MSSKRGVLHGQQAPRAAHIPPADWSHADDAAFLASSYGLTPDPWQFDVLTAWLGARANGRWSATTCGLSVPRQNGKNALLEIRELYGMVALGEKFLHTAHEVKTARKAFLRLASFFENDRKYPELAALLAGPPRKTNGQEAIILRNGASVEFVARSKGSGRGFTVDVLVLDEAQELSDEALQALKPTLSAAPQQNPQTIYTGTPPAPTMNGEVWTRVRRQGVTGKGQRLAWHEWSVPGHWRDHDLDDRALWAATNPALGGRLNIEVIEDERREFDDEGFARERLGWWEPVEAVTGDALDVQAWIDLTDPESSADRVDTFAVETAPDRSWTSISAVGTREDGLRHVELVERRRGVAWAVPRCVELDKVHGPTQWVVDGGGPAHDLIGPLQDEGLEVITAGTRDVADAYARIVDLTEQGGYRHGPQPDLLDAVKVAKKRPCGDGGSAFGRRVSGADISPIVTVSLALWAADLVTSDQILW
jgi:hypothetical protein